MVEIDSNMRTVPKRHYELIKPQVMSTSKTTSHVQINAFGRTYPPYECTILFAYRQTQIHKNVIHCTIHVK